jgi:hypothetical protein
MVIPMNLTQKFMRKNILMRDSCVSGGVGDDAASLRSARTCGVILQEAADAHPDP